MSARLTIPFSLLLVGLACKNETNIDALDYEGEIVPGEPVAIAGPDQIVAPMDPVQLDGSSSFDPEGGQIVAYEWEMISKPQNSLIDIEAPTLARPVFTPDLLGDYVVELSVKNDQGNWDHTPDVMTVQAKQVDGFAVQLTWNTGGTDMDLHLVKGSAPLFDPDFDCYWCNRQPEWGLSGGLDNPFLLADQDNGYGPETITLDAPEADVYQIYVHYFGSFGYTLECAGACQPTTVTLQIVIDGSTAATYTRNLNTAGRLWHAATIAWPAKSVTEVNTVVDNFDEGC